MGAEETRAETAVGRVLKGQVAVVTGRAAGSAGPSRNGSPPRAPTSPSSPAHHEVAEAAAALQRGGVRALGLRADVTRGEDVDAAFEEVRDRLRPPTLVVNNAGLFSAVGPVWEVDPEAWWRDVEVSLRGTFLCSRAALRSMVPGGGGRILNMTSLSGTRPSPRHGLRLRQSRGLPAHGGTRRGGLPVWGSGLLDRPGICPNRDD